MEIKKLFFRVIIDVLISFITIFSIKAQELPNDFLLRNGEIIVSRCESSGNKKLAAEVCGVIDIPIEVVWKFISDYNNIPKYAPRLKVVYAVEECVAKELAANNSTERSILESFSKKYKLKSCLNDTVYLFNVFDMPFPVDDRWCLMEIYRDSSKYRICRKLITGNMQYTEGMWELKNYNGSKQTLATFSIQTDLGFPLPDFLINLGLEKMLPDIIERLRQETKQAKVECASLK